MRASSIAIGFGAAALLVVVLTHIAERLGVFPGMGWGQPRSAGHYLDLISAISGVVLLTIGCVARVLARRRASD